MKNSFIFLEGEGRGWVVPTDLRKQWETCSIETFQRLSSQYFMDKGAQVRLKSYCLYLILRRGWHPVYFDLKYGTN